MDFVTDLARVVVIGEMMYAGDLVMMIETIESLRYTFRKWKEVFESNDLKADLGKTRVMVCIVMC